MKIKIKNKKIFFLLSLFLLIGVFFLLPNITHAGGEVVVKVLGYILYPFIWFFGKLIALFIWLFVRIAQYNDFIHSNAVTLGWTMVRDICNMFFILILLIIAFATILRVEKYNIKALLPKLILMAVLINFSKMICGVFIDLAQVVMLTFVNAFKDLAGGNFLEMVGITKILSLDQASTDEVSVWSILGAVFLAFIFSFVSVFVILTMFIVLAMRIIMLWIYIVLSPLAYFLASFPQGQQYSQRWWTEFSKNLTVGPILAFFVWLAFASLGGVEGGSDITMMMGQEDIPGNAAATITEAGSPDHVAKFIISIGMLLGGLMIAQEMGGAVGKIAGKGMAKIQDVGSKLLNNAKNMGGNIGKGALRLGGEGALRGIGSLPGVRNTRVGELAKNWGKDLGTARKKRWDKKTQDVLQKMGIGEHASKALAEMTGGMRDRWNSPRQARIDARNRSARAEGQRMQSEGERMMHEGEIRLTLAQNLEDAQDKQLRLEAEMEMMDERGLAKDAPERMTLQDAIEANQANLESLKVEAGLSPDASSLAVLGAIGQNRSLGNKDIADGEKLLRQGQERLSEDISGKTMVARGQEEIERGRETRRLGRNTLDQANQLETAQNRYEELELQLSRMPDNDPDRERVQAEFDANASDLNQLKISAGLDADADANLVYSRVQDMRESSDVQMDRGDAQVRSGENMVREGNFLIQREKKRKRSGLGKVVWGSISRVADKMNADYNDAHKFVENLSEEVPDIKALSATKFSDFGGDLNLKQVNTWKELNDSKNPNSIAAAKNLHDALEKLLFDDAENPKTNIGSSQMSVIKAIARGIQTFKNSNGGSVSSQVESIEKLINNYVDKTDGAGDLKRVDAYKSGSVASYRLVEDEKEGRGMDVNQSGIGSINKYAKGDGDDLISYNFDRLKDRGVDLENIDEKVDNKGRAVGAYIKDEETKERVRKLIIFDINKELGELGALSPEEKKELENLGFSPDSKDKPENKYDNFSAHAKKQRIDSLQKAKSRLEAGDNFSLIDANKQMGKDEAIVSGRHESIHKEVDEYRKERKIKQTQAQESQEESMAEFYGQKAMENKISQSKDMNSKIAQIIVDGQQKGMSDREMKINIENAVRGEKVSKLIEKESGQSEKTEKPKTKQEGVDLE